MKRDRFLKNSLIMIFSNLITGIFGFVFSIILSRNMGAEGIGLYGLIMPIYDLFICLICGGIIPAISRRSAIYYSKNDFRNLNRTIDVSLIFDCILAIVVAVFVFSYANFISIYIIKDTRTIQALQIICPAMIFISLSSIFKGYFYGVSDIKVPALIDVSEKFIRIIIFVSIITVFNLKTVKSTVTGAYMTLTLGELISFILLYIFYKRKKAKLGFSYTASEDKLQLLFDVLIISFPLCITDFITMVLSTTSTLIVPRRLISSGIEYNTALSMIGKFNGMAMNIIFFPMIIVNSISTILIPDLSEKLSKKDYWQVENRIAQVIKIAFILGMTTLVICSIIPNILGSMLYSRNDLGSYIHFCTLAAPLAYVSSASYAILNGLGKQNIILKNSLIVSFEELIILYLLTPIKQINVYSYGISLILTSGTGLIMNLYEIRKIYFIDFSKYEFSIYILASILLYLILYTIKNFVSYRSATLEGITILFTGFLCTLIFLISVVRKRRFS